MRGEAAAGATSDLPPSLKSTKGRGRLPGNTIPIAAGCRVAQKKTLIIFSITVSRGVPVLHKLRPDGATFQSHQWVPVIYQQSCSQQNDGAAASLQPAGVFAQLMKNSACVVLFLGRSLRPTYLNILSTTFFSSCIIFMWDRLLLVVCLENLFGCKFPFKNKSWGMPASCADRLQSVPLTCQSLSFLKFSLFYPFPALSSPPKLVPKNTKLTWTLMAWETISDTTCCISGFVLLLDDSYI